MKINVVNGTLSSEEINKYADYIQKKYPYETIDTLDIILDGEDVELKAKFVPYKIERIRRITGYLVGTTDRWNDAKQAELKDRKKHM